MRAGACCRPLTAGRACAPRAHSQAHKVLSVFWQGNLKNRALDGTELVDEEDEEEEDVDEEASDNEA